MEGDNKNLYLNVTTDANPKYKLKAFKDEQQLINYIYKILCKRVDLIVIP